MLIRSFLVLSLLAGFLACKRSSGDGTPFSRGVDSINVMYLMGQPDVFFFNTVSAITVPIFGLNNPRSVQFKYIGDRLVQRNGGFVTITFSGGQSYQYSLEVFDKVEYFKDSIIITQDDTSPDYQMLPARRKLILENNRLKTKIYYNVRGDGRNDTLDFSYGANGKVSQTVGTTRNGREVKTFFYSAAGNLEKVTGISYLRNSPGVVFGESLQTFEGYDNAVNPLKNLWLWDDTFYRTLSNNNYTKFTSTSVSGSAHSTSTRNWTLKYDNKGRVLFNQ